MVNLKTMNYNVPFILYNDNFQVISLEKTYVVKGQDHYFIRIFQVGLDNSFTIQAYLYFSINFQKAKSSFIGVFTKPELRGNGLSSFLISLWIKICFDNNILNLDTIKKQRKPFIIYSLKKFSFELKNLDLYETSNQVVYICYKLDLPSIPDSSKYLLFKSNDQKNQFLNSRIPLFDNYFVLDELDSNFGILEMVKLNSAYFLMNPDYAYERAEEKIKTFGIK